MCLLLVFRPAPVWSLSARQLSRDRAPGGGVTKLINRAINNDRTVTYWATILM